MSKIIREILALLWKLVRTYVLKWLKAVAGKVLVFSVLILSVVVLLAVMFGRCLRRPGGDLAGARRGAEQGAEA